MFLLIGYQLNSINPFAFSPSAARNKDILQNAEVMAFWLENGFATYFGY